MRLRNCERRSRTKKRVPAFLRFRFTERSPEGETLTPAQILESGTPAIAARVV